MERARFGITFQSGEDVALIPGVGPVTTVGQGRRQKKWN